MTRPAEVVATGLGVPEGPFVHADGAVTFTEQIRGRISRWDGRGGASVVALTGGAPNSHVAGPGGVLYACQNGGVVGGWRSPQPATPGIQVVAVDGTVTDHATAVAGAPLLAPNDLVVTGDGDIVFTDPGHPFDPVARGTAGRLVRLSPSAPASGEVLLDVGATYCNGLALEADGTLVWVESYGRHVCRLVDGARVEVCRLPEGHVPDGLAVATDGRLFIATCGSHGVTVVAPDGEVLELIELDDDANATNCCFDGDGALWVTDFGMDWETREGAGRLWRVETDATGLPVPFGPTPR